MTFGFGEEANTTIFYTVDYHKFIPPPPPNFTLKIIHGRY